MDRRAPHRYHVFDTAHGAVAIGWRSGAVTALRLPSPTPRAAEAALRRRLPDAAPCDPPPGIARIVAMVREYFAGARVDFAAVPVDLGAPPPFFDHVYRHVRALRWGERTTYGEVARALGAGPEAARAVGQAMAANPVPLIVPCHRVLAAGGRVGGFSAPGGSDAKARMLALEGHAPPAPAQAGFAF